MLEKRDLLSLHVNASRVIKRPTSPNQSRTICKIAQNLMTPLHPNCKRHKWIWPLRPTFKNPNLGFKNELNLNFTVKNKKDNLHKIRLSHYKVNIIYEIFNFLEFNNLLVKMN